MRVRNFFAICENLATQQIYVIFIFASQVSFWVLRHWCVVSKTS